MKRRLICGFLFNMGQNICLFGDSITWGACDSDKGGWAARLRNYLENNNFNVNIYNCAVSGDNTDKLLKRFKVEALARKPNLIIFAIGINDSQYVNSKDNPRVPLEKFEENLQELINQAKEFTNQIVFVGITRVDGSKTMPLSWNPIKYYDEENIKLYDTKIKEVCEKNNLLFIEMFDLLNDSDLEDGLHPNPQGHEKMFLRIKNFLFSNNLIQ